ncbi:hypothetical protein K474DRAFT_1743338 [Panus rudis PR-1116 ss-1]|nr:hypothetical protein K474DRAFT_1743338 [Panus rudis PR-1116 ss-1]
MSFPCHGCDRVFDSEGALSLHAERTRNPACRAESLEVGAIHFVDSEDEDADTNMGDPPSSSDSLSPPHFQGDLFGAHYDESDFEPFGDPVNNIHSATSEGEMDMDDNDRIDMDYIDHHSESSSEDEDELAANPGAELPGRPQSPLPPPARDARIRIETALRDKLYSTPYPSAKAGAPLEKSQLKAGYHLYANALQSQHNPYAPFKSELDWHVARWAKLRGPGSTAVTELLSIPENTRELNGLIDQIPNLRPRFKLKEIMMAGEIYEVYFRDALECVRVLFAEPEFAQYMVTKPERFYADADKTKRVYWDMHTAKWWWATQCELDSEKEGGTVVPIIISTDKTQVTLFRNKMAYPVYLTIGNLPKEIRRKPSQRGQVLLGYLPTTKLDHITNASARRRMLANLFHASMREVLSPLKQAGEDGVGMMRGDGLVFRCHPIFAAYVGDYLEQLLVAGVKYGECPICQAPREKMCDPETRYPFRDLEAVLEILAIADDRPADYLKECKHAGVRPIYRPFWDDLPYSDVFLSITPDILHQLYQGVIKHLVSWIKSAYSHAEIDARCRRLPRNHNVRAFMKGITGLEKLTGQEHGDIARILLGLIADLRLPNGMSSARLVKATRAMLDFLYLAQYPVHSTETLDLLDDARKRFHHNKSIFEDLGIRTQWGLPKLHSLDHYRPAIERLGTPDNFNTEYTERLHINFAKDAYEASNKKDEYPQMTQWLDRLARDYGAVNFRHALARYIVQQNQPNLSGPRQRRNLEIEAVYKHIPFVQVPVFYKVRFWSEDFPRFRNSNTYDVVHCRPSYPSKRDPRKIVPGRFDTVLVSDGSAQHDAGPRSIQHYCVARVRTVFVLPQSGRQLLLQGANQTIHLAYVEWFTPFSAAPDSTHGMYKISPAYRDGIRATSVIPLSNIFCSVHLFPIFGPVVDRTWTADGVLDQCPRFYVNPFSDRHAFGTIL